MEGRDYGEIVRDGRLAAELEMLDGAPRYVCPYCKDVMGVRSKAIRDRTEYRFYFDHRTAHYRETCAGQRGHSPDAILARKFGLHKEGALHKTFKQWVRDSLDADPTFAETKVEERWWDGMGDGKWRQPDVQTMRDGQRWAIEIQLSTTFVHVIAERMKFYRENAGRMLWLFRDLDLSKFRLSEDDLFFSNNRNAFRVTPSTVERSQREGRFYLEGAWLEPRFEDGHIVDTEVRREVPFDALVVDTCRGIPRVYAFDYEGHKVRAQQEKAAWQQAQVWLPRREAFEAFYVTLLRGEFEDFEERDRRWEELRRSFAQMGIALPQYAKGDAELERLLVAGYSAKHGQGHPIGIGFETLAELGHHIHKVSPKTLWFYRCTLRMHGQLQTVLRQDRTGRLQEKMKQVLTSLACGESTFQPNRSWDHLLVHLFPEIATVWAADPSQLARAALSSRSRSHVTKEANA